MVGIWQVRAYLMRECFVGMTVTTVVYAYAFRKEDVRL